MYLRNMQKNCPLFLQVAAAQSAGAIAAIVYDDSIDDYFLMLADGDAASTISIPSASVPRKYGQLLISSALVGSTILKGLLLTADL